MTPESSSSSFRNWTRPARRLLVGIAAVTIMALEPSVVHGFSVDKPGSYSCSNTNHDLYGRSILTQLPSSVTPTTTMLRMAANNDGPNEEQLKAIMEDEAMNDENLKASAEAMKNMKPGDLDKLLAEMDSMPSWQKDQLKKMGMDPDIVKQSMEIMKQNPEMMKTAAQAMENMTPEQLMERSKQAQEGLRGMTASGQTNIVMEDNEENRKLSLPKDVELVSIDKEDDEEKDDDDDDEDDEDDEPIEPEPHVLDAMFTAGELMSEPPTGGVTFAGFCTVPPIAVLLAGTGEDDLTKKEVTECWNKGSLGSTRVDKAGFKRVWMQVQDNYYGDIMEEARERTLVRKKSVHGGAKEKPKAPSTTIPTTPSSATTTSSTTPMVGSAVSPEQLSQQLKNMKDEDVQKMLNQFTNMSPADEARMKAMGVDPAMMKKSAEMMNSNAFLRKGFTAMMKNTNPDQLMQQSRMAQEKLANMTDEEKKKYLDGLK